MQRVIVLQKQINRLETLQPPGYEQKVADPKAQLEQVKSRLEFLLGKRRTHMRQHWLVSEYQPSLCKSAMHLKA